MWLTLVISNQDNHLECSGNPPHWLGNERHGSHQPMLWILVASNQHNHLGIFGEPTTLVIGRVSPNVEKVYLDREKDRGGKRGEGIVAKTP